MDDGFGAKSTSVRLRPSSPPPRTTSSPPLRTTSSPPSRTRARRREMIALPRWPEIWRAGVNLFGVVNLKTLMETTSGVIRRVNLLEFGYEAMIGSRGGQPILMQGQLGAVDGLRAGFFQAGFWGYGVNSYAVYYARATERSTLFLRLPYGAGAYCTDPERERADALAILRKYPRLVETLLVRHAQIVASMGEVWYDITRLDDSVVSASTHGHLDTFDFEALARRS